MANSLPLISAGRLGAWCGRRVGLALAVLLLGAGTPSAGSGQDLPLKRQVPGAGGYQCPSSPDASEPTPAESAEAARLGSDAATASILGDRDSARDLLERATRIDPRSQRLAYDYGRVLEDLGDRSGAGSEYCRVLALDASSPDATDVQRRLDGFAEEQRRAIPGDAVASFQAGLADADAGQLDSAVDRFNQAVSLASTWAQAIYNRGVVFARLERRDEAMADLRLYQQLAPDAADLADVSEWIGRLQNAGGLPSPGAAFTLGIFLPGMGQFYSGRPLAGLTYLTLVGGGLAAAFFIEDIEIRCVEPQPPGEDCPPALIHSRDTTNPYRWYGIGAAAGVTLIAAIEALVKARGRRAAQGGEAFSLRVGDARILTPGLARRGARTELHLLRIRF